MMDYRRFFVEQYKIGSGGYGHVYKCKHVINNIDLGTFAVKKVPVGDNQDWLFRVLTEVKALETLKKHPNIINYQHSWLENDKTADFGTYHESNDYNHIYMCFVYLVSVFYL